MAGTEVIVAGDRLTARLAALPTIYQAGAEAEDLALFQYMLGTTRELPAAVKYTHRTIVFPVTAPRYWDDLAVGEALPGPGQDLHPRQQAGVPTDPQSPRARDQETLRRPLVVRSAYAEIATWRVQSTHQMRTITGRNCA